VPAFAMTSPPLHRHHDIATINIATINIATINIATINIAAMKSPYPSPSEAIESDRLRIG